MIDINELRRLALDGDLAAMQEIILRLEAAEKSNAESLAMCRKARDERDALRAKVEAMERQEPYAFAVNFPESSRVELVHDLDEAYEDMTYEAYEVRKLYLAPGAQPAPKAVAYLDLGVGGYMDIGTDLTDEALAALPKGRHMLGIVGTYGVDGYVQAQPAPNIPDDVMRDAKRYRFLRAAKNIPISTEAARDPVVYDEAIDRAMLAAAPEAKP